MEDMLLKVLEKIYVEGLDSDIVLEKYKEVEEDDLVNFFLNFEEERLSIKDKNLEKILEEVYNERYKVED